MATPVLVKAYPTPRSTPLVMRRSRAQPKETLPPISSYAFADILRAADSKDFQQALDGIAEICAKNRMSLSDEYASHMPPVGDITTTNASATLARPQVLRPGMRRALTSVPEASSGSSEGSRGSKKRGSGLFWLEEGAGTIGASHADAQEDADRQSGSLNHEQQYYGHGEQC